MEKEENKKYDPREVRPIAVHGKKQKSTIILGHNEIYQLKDAVLTFKQPNNISICLNISNREYDIAIKIFTKSISPKLKSNPKIEFTDSETTELFNYFEHLQASLIFIYTAVEAFSNVAIPENFELEKINSKKVKEIWTKESIERWLSTSEKIGDIIPNILKVSSPKQEMFWSKFKKLEEIRNEIIHQKTTKDERNVSSRFLKYFFNNEIFKIIRSGFLVLEFFCSTSEYAHIYFPLGMGKSELKPIVVEDLEEVFAPIEE